MAKGDNTWLWIILIVGAGIVFWPQISGFLGTAGTSTGTTATTINQVSVCPDNIAFTSDDVRKDQIGQNPGQSYRLFVGSSQTSDLANFPTGFVDKGSTADAASVTVPTKVPYLEIAGWNGGTQSLVYREKLTGNTDCQTPLTVQPVLAIGDTNVTAYFTDQDGSLNSGNYGTGTFNMTTGTGFDFTPTFSVSADQYWSNPYTTAKGVLVLQYNNTLYQDIVSSDLASAPVPDIARNNGTGWTRKAYFLDPLKPGQLIHHTFTAKVLSGKGVSGAETAAAHNSANIYFEMYDATYGLRTDNNNLFEGVQDELNANMGMVDTLNRFTEHIGGLN